MDRLVAVVVIAAAVGLCAVSTAGPARDPLVEGFRSVPMPDRMRMFWRVFGPAWEPAEIDYQLGLMRDAGIGGVTTFFFYPVALDDPAHEIVNRPFLSPEFLQSVGYAANKAKALDMRFTVAGGTGWPYGGPQVTIEDSAHRIRREVVQPPSDGSAYTLPRLRAGESIVAAFAGGKQVAPRIDGLRSACGEALTLFIAGPTGMQVKRPALGGDGLVVDHYSAAALNRFLEQSVASVVAASNGAMRSLFCDSLEVYRSNWVSDLPAEFRKRRGYDLIPRLPALFDLAHQSSGALRSDFWRTLAELHEERFTKALGDWARAHGIGLEMEAYGTPPDPLTSARYIDVPTGEQYEWKGFSFQRFAASGAHLCGKRIVGAEAWTWTGVPNRLADSLSDIKLVSDMTFLAGANDMTGVDFAYSPRSAGSPGWLPYFGPVFNQNNPQWPCFHYLADYVNRCQWMLRQGKPVAEIAIYLPVEESFAKGPLEQMPLDFLVRDHFVTGEKTDEFGLDKALRHHSDLLHGLISHGHNFDGIDFWAMNQLARVRAGRLIAGDGDYGVVVLPNLEWIDVQAFGKIARFVESGGTLVATERLPVRAAGLQGEAGATAKLHALLDRLFATHEAVPAQSIDRRVGKGRVCFTTDRDAWRTLTDREDLELHPWQATVGFVHRRATGRDIYFVANVGEEAVSFSAIFRAPGSVVEMWDPTTGVIRRLAYFDLHSGRSVRVMLPARGSTFIVMGERGTAGAVPPEAPSSGERRREEIVLRGPWKVSFSGPEAPADRNIPELALWTDWADARYFSGHGTYSTTFEWSGPLPRRCVLSLGRVHEVAEVRVNGKVAGAVWNPPWEVDITTLVRAGANPIEIAVGNFLVNRFIGLPRPDLRALRAVYGNRFPDPAEHDLMKSPAPSGLAGPVRLIVER